MSQSGNNALRRCGRVVVKFGRIVASGGCTGRFTDSLPFRLRNSLLLKNQKLEARVGIGRVSPSTSHSKSIVYVIADTLTLMELRSLSSVTPSLLPVTRFNPIRRVFAGTSAGTFLRRPELRHAGPNDVNREAEPETPSRVACSESLCENSFLDH
jgi:hypothetical protein